MAIWGYFLTLHWPRLTLYFESSWEEAEQQQADHERGGGNETVNISDDDNVGSSGLRGVNKVVEVVKL